MRGALARAAIACNSARCATSLGGWRASHAAAAAETTAARRAAASHPEPQQAHRSVGGLTALAVAAAAGAAAAAGYVYTGQHAHGPASSATSFPTPPPGSTAPAPQAGAAPASPPVDRAALLADLRCWLVANGADVDAIDIRPCSENSAGVGVFATPSIAARSRRGVWRTLADWAAWRSPDVVLASFPLSTAVTPAAALADPDLGPLYADLLASGAADERALVMLFLALERAKGRASAWAPWLAALPREFGTPLYFSAAERGLLAGTNLGRAADLLSARLAAAWDGLAPSAARLAKKAGLATPPCLADFTWAYSVFWSRGMAFPAPAIAAGGAGGGGGGGPNTSPAAVVVAQEGILPGLDFCNHAPGAPVRWTVYGAGGGGGGGGGAAPSAAAPPPAPAPAPTTPPADPPPPQPTHAALVAPRWGVPRPGAEVLIDYGGKSQEELLLLYGFAHARADGGDVLMVACPLPGVSGAGEGMAWDDDLRARVALLRCRGLTPQVFLPALAGGGGAGKGWWTKGGGGGGAAAASPPTRPRKASPVNPASPGAGLPLPAGVWDTLEAFVLEPAAVASARADPDGAAPPRASAADARGLRMAVLTTLTRLLEAAVVGLEGPAGTGPLEADVAALAADASGDPPPPGAPDLSASPHARACVAYRATQKRIARDWLAEARGLLAAEMAALDALLEK